MAGETIRQRIKNPTRKQIEKMKKKIREENFEARRDCVFHDLPTEPKTYKLKFPGCK